MSITAEAPGAAGGLTHLGVVYDEPDDLVDAVLPHVRNALRAGDAVSTLVDRRTARELRDALGEQAGDVAFRTPGEIPGPQPQSLLRNLRTLASPARRGLVLAQYSAFAMSDAELAIGEAGINLVLADLPLTMVCACGRSACDELLDASRHSHPHVIRGRVTEGNPSFRVPDDRCPTDAETWGGAHVLRLLFRDTGDLARIREHVASLAGAAGLGTDDSVAAVFAVHEAAVLACDGVEHARHPDPCVLDVWTAPGRLAVDVCGPHPDAGFVVDDGSPRLPRNRQRIPDPMRYVRMFCPDVVALGSDDTRTIRIEAAARLRAPRGG